MWRQNHLMIEAHNSARTHEDELLLGHSKFSDVTHGEFKDAMLSHGRPPLPPEARRVDDSLRFVDAAEVPVAVDWRDPELNHAKLVGTTPCVRCYSMRQTALHAAQIFGWWNSQCKESDVVWKLLGVLDHCCARVIASNHHRPRPTDLAERADADGLRLALCSWIQPLLRWRRSNGSLLVYQ